MYEKKEIDKMDDQSPINTRGLWPTLGLVEP